MHRRELLTGFAATAAGLTTVAAAREARAAQGGKDDLHDRCAKNCADTMNACNKGFHHCYRQVAEGKKEHASTMHLCVDCADICGTAAALVARMSPLMLHTCKAAADCCEGLLAQCEKLNDPEMKSVVEACGSCAKSCREMVEAMSGR
jgi:hypothetical protein